MPRLPVAQATEQARSAGLLRNSEISAEAMGAGIGRAVQGLGSAIGGLGGALAGRSDRANQKAMTQAQINVANLTGNAQMEMVKMEAAAPPDAAGFSDGYSTYYDN